MLTFMVRRTILSIFTLFFLSIVSYAIIQLPPGDWVDLYIAEMRASTQDVPYEVWQEWEDNLRKTYGLDQSLYVQYLKWAGKMVRGDFGMSLQHNRPISELIGERMMMTVVLAGATILFTWVLAIPIGIYSAVRQRSVGDYTFTFLGFIGLAVPDFLLALILMYFSFVYLNASIGGLFSRPYINAPWSLGRVWDLAQHLWIPCIVLGTSGTAGLIRIMRANLLDELRKPYVVTARSKGLPELRVILKYPVRVALNPLISTVGYTLPAQVSGSVIVSVVMSLPTVGPVMLYAFFTQDMFVAATIIMLLGTMTVIGTLLSDILLVMVDPRIRMERS